MEYICLMKIEYWKQYWKAYEKRYEIERIIIKKYVIKIKCRESKMRKQERQKLKLEIKSIEIELKKDIKQRKAIIRTENINVISNNRLKEGISKLKKAFLKSAVKHLSKTYHMFNLFGVKSFDPITLC